MTLHVSDAAGMHPQPVPAGVAHGVAPGVAIVTGGGANLGGAIVRRLVDAGITVVVADINEPAEALPGTHYVRTDVADPDSVDALVHDTFERFGRIDHLVNNAAVWFRRPVLEITPDEWDRVLAINLRGPFLTCRAVAPIMAAQGGGTIVNVGSQAGLGYTRGQGAHYQASKAALVQFTRVLSFEFGPTNVRVNCVAPGSMRDPSIPIEGPAAAFAAQTPLGRFASTEEVAEACHFLLSDRSSAITGQTLLVNGGAIAYL